MVSHEKISFSYHKHVHRYTLEHGNLTLPLLIGVRAGGGGGGRARGASEGGCSPPSLKIFGQNAYDSGKSTSDKLFIESSFYNTTKWSLLKRLNGSVRCRSLDAGICCSFAPNFLANSQKVVERVRFVKSLLFK